MSVFDFNIHLYTKEKGDVDKGIIEDTELNAAHLIKNYNKYISHLKDSDVSSTNFMLFNSMVLYDEELNLFIKKTKTDFHYSSFTILIDFRYKDPEELINLAVDYGFSFIKFHSYVQRIGADDFSSVLKIAQYAEEKGIGICVDTSFGTNAMYKYDNLKLAAFLSEFIKKSPIVLLHSGGTRILEAMLLADLNKNIYLETSLSLPFFQGSSIMKDFAYSFRKIGADRVIYASDFPFMPVDKSVEFMHDFLNEYGFSDSETENIMHNNAINLIDKIQK